jgi:hypothetical protein
VYIFTELSVHFYHANYCMLTDSLPHFEHLMLYRPIKFFTINVICLLTRQVVREHIKGVRVYIAHSVFDGETF